MLARARQADVHESDVFNELAFLEVAVEPDEIVQSRRQDSMVRQLVVRRPEVDGVVLPIEVPLARRVQLLRGILEVVPVAGTLRLDCAGQPEPGLSGRGAFSVGGSHHGRDARSRRGRRSLSHSPRGAHPTARHCHR